MLVRLPVRYKIVLPFLVLLLFVGLVGTAVVSTQVTNAAVEGFDGALLRASLLANDHLAILEAERLSELRAASDTIGIPEAVAAGDRAALARLLQPIQANAHPAQLIIRVLNRQSQQLLAIDENGLTTVSPIVYAEVAPVEDALTGRSDVRGDKFVYLAPERSGGVLYWIGPVRTDSGSVVGAMLLGEPLAEIATSIRSSGASELAFYDSSGQVLVSSIEASPALAPSVRTTITEDRPVRVSEKLRGHSYVSLASDWRMRGTQLGYVAVALTADPLEASIAQVRLILVVLFVAAALLALALGSTLATRITRPLEALVSSMRAVAAGDLSQRASPGPPDEIGYLARTFNHMTESLQEKNRTLDETYFASMQALARAIDARDPYTLGHSARVAAISLELALAMHLPDREREPLRRAALLHDIGKIGVEDRILRKPGPLNELEREALQGHPVIGHEMLAGLRFLRDSLPGVRHHHERWDGSGYPDGLQGPQIPLIVRIISVADAFDAITSDRPYRRGLSFAAAAKEIVAGSGTQFDPAVVSAFRFRFEAITAALTKMGKTPAQHPVEITWLEDAS